MECKTNDVFCMDAPESEELMGESITLRLPESMTKDLRVAMKLTGLMKKSEFVRQAVILRMREVREAAKAREVVSGTKTALFARRSRTKKEAA